MPSLLIEDKLSKKPRIPKKINKFLRNHYLYFFPEYPLANLSHIPGAAEDYLSDNKLRNYYVNLDYKMIEHRDHPKRIVGEMCNLSNFLITSMDQTGISSPLNFYDSNSIHPGNKRLLCARYLNLKYVPVVWQSFIYIPGLTRITTLEDIYNIYGTNISINLAPKSYGPSRLEISWHGETHRRDHNGYDDWYTTSRLRTEFSILDYLLTHGLEIVNSTIEKEITNTQYPIKYTKARKNKISIEILDNSLMDENLDFWELYFHIDPTVASKLCKTKRIRIINDYATGNTLTECNLYNTLIRRKYHFD
jgi:hypothetical protein